MPLVCVLNQKGGVGKTSICYHLAGTLAQHGRRVLLVDNAPMASLTYGFIDRKGMRELPTAETIAAIFAGDYPLPMQVIRNVLPYVDLLPGSRLAGRFDLPEPHTADPGLQGCLKEFLGEIRGRYDIILVDCPPNLQLLAWAALVASDSMVVPLNPEDFGAQGITEVMKSFGLVTAGPNPGLRLAGYLINRIDSRLSIHTCYEEAIRELYNEDVFKVTVPCYVDLVDAIVEGKPVGIYKPKGAAAKVMELLAEELESRISPLGAHSRHRRRNPHWSGLTRPQVPER